MSASVIVAGARTPIGKLGGALSPLTAVELGSHAIAAAVQRAGVAANDVDSVIMGTVVQAGVGPNPARQSAVAAGLPMTVPATTVNNLCLSGLQAIISADHLIRSGDADVVIAGGMESMSNAPYLARGARKGYRYGPHPLEDALDRDALTCAFDQTSMGAATERYQAAESFTRVELDAFAAQSHRRAAAATANSTFATEIVPVEISSRRGNSTITADEGIRPDTTLESLARLKPAFVSDGTTTAGSSSQLSDGACALVIMRKEVAQARNIEWLAEIRSHALVAGPDTSLLHQPSNAIAEAIRRSKTIALTDLDLIEVNEAFASVAIASMRDLEITDELVNVNGGAIALGHPVGMSGARVTLTLMHALRRRGGGLGAAALCGGGGQGIAIILESPRSAAPN
ncbi:MAG: acetyl-CoA C-acyltransferase [Hyphomicrobiales bacterium]|nr:MAG: acetyl-CoA C-acyltransferase [Hyphomicrobiales bacterium]